MGATLRVALESLRYSHLTTPLESTIDAPTYDHVSESMPGHPDRGS